MYTPEQAFTLGQLYRSLSIAVRGDNVNQAELNNAQAFPWRTISQVILRAHQMRRVSPSLDRKIAYFLSGFSPEEMQYEASAIPLELQGSFQLGYTKGSADVHADALGVRAARTACRMSTQQLADAVGVTIRQVQRWESLEQIPPLSMAQKIAEILHCSVNDLF